MQYKLQLTVNVHKIVTYIVSKNLLKPTTMHHMTNRQMYQLAVKHWAAEEPESLTYIPWVTINTLNIASDLPGIGNGLIKTSSLTLLGSVKVVNCKWTKHRIIQIYYILVKVKLKAQKLHWDSGEFVLNYARWIRTGNIAISCKRLALKKQSILSMNVCEHHESN